MPDDQTDSDAELSLPDTQFVFKEGDDEALWDVIEITAEKDRQYKVRWAGTDPATGKPWPQSWVAKHDCTDILVEQWKGRRAKERKQKQNRRSNSTSKTSSSKSTRDKPRSTSDSVASRSRSTSHPSRVVVEMPPVQSTSKRKLSTTELSDLQDSVEETVGIRKKRKVQAHPSIPARNDDPPIVRKRKRRKARPLENDDERDAFTDDIGRQQKPKSKAKGKGKTTSRIPDIFDIIPGTEQEDELLSEAEATHFSPAPESPPPPDRKKKSKRVNGGQSRDKSTRRSRKEKQALPSTNLEHTRSDSEGKHKAVDPSRSPSAPSSPPPIIAESPRASLLELEQPASHDGENVEEFDSPFDVDSFPNSEVDVPSPGPATRTPPRITSGNSRPLRHEVIKDDSIVPETETQSSLESQHQPTVLSRTLLDRSPVAPGADHDDNKVLFSVGDEVPITEVHPTTPKGGLSESGASAASPRRPTLVSRMKPKGLASTLRSSSPVLAPSVKPLGRIPVVTPSKFRPHLPTTEEGIDEDGEPEREDEFLMSSIESFSSPFEVSRRRNPWSPLVRAASSMVRRGEEEDNGAIRRRGQELAEQAMAKKSHQMRQGRKRKTLTSLLAFTNRAAGSVIAPTVKSGWKGVEPDEGAGRNGAQWGQDSPQEEEVAREMEDAYVDLSGGDPATAGTEDATQDATGSPVVRRAPVRMEEEESTQDLVQEMEAFRAARMQLGLVPIELAEHEDADEDDAVETLLTQDRAFTSPIPDKGAAALLPPSRTRSPSLQPDRSVSSPVVHLTIQEQSEDMLELPPTASTGSKTPESQLLGRSKTYPFTVTDKLALGLLHTKSVEIESLEQSVAREQAKAEDYVVKIRQLESRLAQASSAVTKELELELEHQLAEARREISDARLAWEADRAGLESTIACLESAKASADKDTAFFREQYANASAHVTHVQSANEELEERTMIAEGRVRENVGILKGLYEERLARLEGEANRWRALCQVLRLKDERTTDFVRSEAAEAVELRGKLRKVRIEADELQGEVESMEEENEELRRTVNSLKLEKAALMAQLKDSPTGQGVVRTGSMDAVREGSGSQEVYRCLWMQNESGKHERCEQFFASIGALEQHVFDAGHVTKV